ncbi:MAG: bifunctional glutamate N-acetyltransferase/amino-acid acetyltransferase ArgJ [Planctomycetota bacterium]
MTEWLADGDLLSVPGWRGAAVRTGVKPSGGLDLALVVADEPRVAAGVFTRNALPAAPVGVCRRTLAQDARVRAIVINSGNANAMTGERGERDAVAMQARTVERVGGPALVLSTGIIGVPLPVERVLAGIDAAAGALAPRCAELADAILTTDTTRKTAALRTADGVTIGGFAKGSGMIHPNMATMLSVVALDVAVEPRALEHLLRQAVERSFHEISVDGDTSTNDAVLLVAGSGDDVIDADSERLPGLTDDVTAVMQRLARAIIDDGEGRTRTLELHVLGARDHDAASRVAEAIVRSALVKTALAGGDPNWGRILAAAANAGVPLEAERVSLAIAGVRVFFGGLPTDYDVAAVSERFGRDEVRVDLDLGAGAASVRRFTTDLSVEYVRINSEYST